MSRRYAPREPYTGPEGPDLPEHLRPVRQYKSKAFVLSPEQRAEALRRVAKRALVALSYFPHHVELCKDIRAALEEEAREGI